MTASVERQREEPITYIQVIELINYVGGFREDLWGRGDLRSVVWRESHC